MEVIGHRGAAALAPENTLAAVDAGLAAGADGVEVDVRATADGTLVLMHDPDVERTTDGTGRVDTLTLAELRTLDAGARFTGDDAVSSRPIVVPTLEEVLARVPRDRLLVLELKGHPWEAGYDPIEPVAHALAAALVADGERRVVVSSFNPLALRVAREGAPGVRTAVLTNAAFDLASNLAAAMEGGHEECHVPATLVDEAFVARAHEAGRRVLAWTVNDPDRLRDLATAGADAVISDDPAAARSALA